MIVVSIAGCMAYLYWRRQRAKLHEDVRQILSTYMPLDEMSNIDFESDGGTQTASSPNRPRAGGRKIGPRGTQNNEDGSPLGSKEAVNYI